MNPLLLPRRRVLGYLGGGLAGCALYGLTSAVWAQGLKNKATHSNEVQEKPQTDPQAGYVFLDSPASVSFPAMATSVVPPFRVVSLSGDVRINGITAVIGDILQAGSVIETGINGIIVYRFYEEAVKLYPQSRLTHGNQPNVWGELYGAMTVALKPSQQPRMVYLPYCTVQINGTGVHINTRFGIFGKNGEPVNSEYICTCYGNALIQRYNNRQNLVRITADHHNFPYLATASEYFASSEIIGHSDAELVELASLLG